MLTRPVLLLRVVWPIPVLALITHILSLLVGILLHRVGRAPGWIIDSLTYNKFATYFFCISTSRIRLHENSDSVTSFPLLTWFFHSRITSLKLSSLASSNAPSSTNSQTGILSHLKWRVLDSVQDVELRGYTYIVVGIVVVEIAR